MDKRTRLVWFETAHNSSDLFLSLQKVRMPFVQFTDDPHFGMPKILCDSCKQMSLD
jgi:hypothetical protein